LFLKRLSGGGKLAPLSAKEDDDEEMGAATGRVLDEYRARGVSQATVLLTESRLERWGRWLKKRRPHVLIEQIGVDLIANYTGSCASFLSKIRHCAQCAASETSWLGRDFGS
jgi:hypothetical protein